MMEKIRTAANSIVVKVIFAIIILAFIFTGVGGLFGMHGNSADDERLYIAKVDGEGIGRAGFEDQVNRAMEQTVALGSDDMVNREVRKQVFLSLVDNHLGYKLSDDLGLKISDDQVKNIITKQRVFFVNGAFNNEQFISLLRQNGYTPDSYAEYLRAEQQKNQLLNALLLTNFALPVESDISQLVDQKREGYYAQVNLGDIVDKSAIDISEDEIKQYYLENTNQFALGDRIKIKFVANTYGDAMKQAQMPTEAELLAAYESNKADYTQPAKYEYVLVRADNQADAKTLDTQIKKSKNIANIDSANLINLGWFAETAIPDYLQLGLTKKGDSTVANLDGSDYVVFLQDIQKPQLLPFEYVGEKLKSELYSQRVQAIYDAKNQKLLDARNKYQTLEEIAKAADLELVEPENWQIKNNPYSIVSNQELNNYLFSDEMVKNGVATQTISDLVEITDPKATYVTQVLDYRPANVAPYEEVHDQIQKQLNQQKVIGMFNTSLSDVVEKLNNGVSDSRINFATKYDLTRDSKEFDQNTVNMIYSLVPPLENKRVFGFNLLDDKTAIVAVLTKVENGEKQDMSAQLTNIDQYAAYADLNLFLRSNAKIEMMPNSNL